MTTELHLYNISDEILKVINECDPETWEIDTEKFDKLEMSLKEKAENISMVSRKFDANIQAIKTEEERLKKMKKHYESQQSKLEDYLKFNMQKLWMDKLETPLFTISIKESEETIIEDITKLPKELKIVEIKASKTDVKKWIKEHWEIEWAKLQKNFNINIK